MTTLAHSAADAGTMLRRNLIHIKHYPSLPILLAGTPVVVLLLFVYVLGGALGDGLGGGLGGDSGAYSGGGRAGYLAYVMPGIAVITIACAAQGTAISVASDMTQGIVARFRSMAISRGAVLTGHVLGSLIQAVAAVALVFATAAIMGYRPAAGFPGWLGALGAAALIALAVIWMAVAMGLAARSVESASNTPMFLMILPFLGSGFAPTDSMPSALRWFADAQPFTPFIETVRALLDGARPGWGDLGATLIWCAVIVGGSYLLAVRLYSRKSVRA
ncbi:MAG: ABC transporter permease [Bifidobacteriaceae bacterium]|jgi:ABC-2 type transport system permease protein|nr:ABC transporter permease [Bifidobacteriaceae bacterium]